MSDEMVPAAVHELIERSNRLGADRRNTNYGGGNTSAKIDMPLVGSPSLSTRR